MVQRHILAKSIETGEEYSKQTSDTTARTVAAGKLRHVLKVMEFFSYKALFLIRVENQWRTFFNMNGTVHHSPSIDITALYYTVHSNRLVTPFVIETLEIKLYIYKVGQR